jgi:DNA-binding winged helix-turn-helix (wHTH) protein/TolB-like protein/Tfp pilus assembly protein PilF
MKTESGTQIYDFDGFRLDIGQRLLSHEGKVVALPPKAIHLLVVLVQNHGRLQEKDDLLKSVWPDTVVEESALAKGIHLLRKTLGESVIVTYPKRGYSFAAPLTEVENEEPLQLQSNEPEQEPVSAQVEPPPVRRRTVQMAWVPVAAVALIALAVSAGILWVRPARIASVAVLPFKSALGQDSLLAVGFTQDLTARLRTLPGLRVVSPFLTTDVRELGTRFGVEAVLTGTLQQSHGRLRASAQLIGVRDGSVLWADEGENFEADDLYAAQRVLASSIASRLRDRVLPAEMAGLLRRGSTNTEAYEAFLKGRAEFIQHLSEAGLEATSKARAFFERAVHLDPGFSDAWGWLAFAKQTQFARGGERHLLKNAVDDAQRALSIDPDSIAARLALINVYHSTGQAEEGLRLAAQSLRINPRDPESILAAAKAYFRGGMLDRAADLYDRYLALNPEDEVARFDSVHVAVFANDCERGLRTAQPALASQRLLFPTFLLYANCGDFAHALPLARAALAGGPLNVHLYFSPLVLKMAGREEEAKKGWEAGAERVGFWLAAADNERSHVWLAMIYAQLKRPEEAREQIRLALALNPEDPWILFFTSETQALLEDRLAALQSLRKSVARGFLGLHYLDYYQKPLYGWHLYRTDPEFLSIREGLARKIAELRNAY